MKNLNDLLQTCNKYINYLKNHNFKFDNSGFPIFTKEMFLDEEPDLIIPFINRNSKYVINKKKTALCTYTPDKRIYPRFNKIFEDIPIYKEYLAVVTADISVTKNMDKEWQELIILLNQLYSAILVVNRIKLLLNTRVGSNDNLILFSNYPKNIICVSGFLGCPKISSYDYSYIAKILYFLPKKLLIYGKEDKNANNMLNKMGINYKYYTDMHRMSKGVI